MIRRFTASLRGLRPQGGSLSISTTVVQAWPREHLFVPHFGLRQGRPDRLRRQRRPPSAARSCLQPWQLHATLAMPKTVERWSLTSLREKLIKIGAKVVSHGRYLTFQMAEVAAPRQIVRQHPGANRSAAGTARAGMSGGRIIIRQAAIGEVLPRYRQPGAFPSSGSINSRLDRPLLVAMVIPVVRAGQTRDPVLKPPGIWRISVHRSSAA